MSKKKAQISQTRVTYPGFGPTSSKTTLGEGREEKGPSQPRPSGNQVAAQGFGGWLGFAASGPLPMDPQLMALCEK